MLEHIGKLDNLEKHNNKKTELTAWVCRRTNAIPIAPKTGAPYCKNGEIRK